MTRSSVAKMPNGEKFDREKVNVRLTAQGGPMNFGHVPSAADCAQVGNQGWYYDNLLTPTELYFCPGTCSQFAAGVLTFNFGCEPLIGPTR